jgi:probable HAF family extracellular repeat protein
LKLSIFRRHFFVPAIVLCLVSFTGESQAATLAYIITDLGTLGGSSSYASGISANGLVCGTSYTVGDTAQHAFLYDGTMHDLGDLGGGYSSASGVNNLGQVVGTSTTAPQDDSGNLQYDAFLYNGTIHDIGNLGGTRSFGVGINNNGLITGSSSLSIDPGTGAAPHDSPYHAFLYNGTLHRIESMSALAESAGNGINSQGQITGYVSSTITLTQDDAYIYDGTMHDIGNLGGTFAEGNAISNNGHVSGWSLTKNAGSHAFFYDGAMHDIGTLGGSNSFAFGINDSDMIVGISNNDPSNDNDLPFLYTPASGMMDLNDLIDPQSDWEITDAEAINDAGQIAGTGVIDGEAHAILLTPVPEPSTIFLISVGAVMLAWPILNCRRDVLRFEFESGDATN